ncbi:hypothetical protein SS1G_09158 [Sclerotinia sclerotiorum 1980 UF-70]|uniref:Rhodopsin domain-containing protein n=2 Tax=Sclerotinia sclerotiorum (strain ATCC 18683 / 1980 / Ss-1) TaxID=665079 RepID=A7EV00_SCLS1|nr:hypothetical protein SS1G_09158 [Sclerotinia sclerotiorum 1980 UF-70]APA15944.1 hypothetical protein sscle_15g107140 [Sclerotinia sclerotiorum 1980 UF-70]EDN93292.1 hypothetical protein SS1G_09158 [Sclerotinia sclerotiorum 1980 UF-70]
MASGGGLEIWLEFAIGMAAFMLRFFARWKHVGFNKFALDDVFCSIAMVFFTLEAGLCYFCETYGTVAGLTATTSPLASAQEKHDFRIGAICLFGAWISFITLTWTLKAILLSLYDRLTLGLRQHKMIKFVAGFCIFSWATCLIAHFAICVPVERNWQVDPYPGDNCVLRRPLQALVGILNILSYLGVMAIPLPLLFAARMPLYRKLILGCLFCSGILVTVIVILRVYSSLRNSGTLSNVIAWAFRESFISVIAATAPGIKPLFNRSNWVNNPSEDVTEANNRVHSSTHKLNGGNISAIAGSKDVQKGVGGRQYIELGHTENWPLKGKKNSVDAKVKEHATSSSSQEHIVAGTDDVRAIHVTTEYALQEEIVSTDSRDSSDTEYQKNDTDIKSGS